MYVAVIFQILQMIEVRPREVNEVAQGHIVRELKFKPRFSGPQLLTGFSWGFSILFPGEGVGGQSHINVIN